MSGPRTATAQRKTAETEVEVDLNLDGTGTAEVHTGIGFFDHMLTSLAKHSLFDLRLKATGDLEVDGHHTVEDVGLVIGHALRTALGDRAGIYRYGSATRTFDEALISAHVDFSGRPYLVYRVDVPIGRVGAFDAELTEVFFLGLATGAMMNLHLLLHYGHNRHHIIEGCFKACGFAMRQAAARDPQRGRAIPSTKGSLD